MRHRVAHRKLGRTTPHRIALLRNLTVALFDKERIRTTLPKAKEVRSFAEKLITLARSDENRLHARRLVARDIQDAAVLKKLFDTLGARFATRPGGYTRILRLGPRHGDGTEMAYLELVGYEYKPATKEEKGKKDAQGGREGQGGGQGGREEARQEGREEARQEGRGRDRVGESPASQPATRGASSRWDRTRAATRPPSCFGASRSRIESRARPSGPGRRLLLRGSGSGGRHRRGWCRG